MPLTGTVSENIHELEHHGTKERSHKQIVAIAISEAKKKGKYSRLHTFLKEAFNRKKGKPSKTYTEPLKTEPIHDTGMLRPITLSMDTVELWDGIRQSQRGELTNSRFGILADALNEDAKPWTAHIMRSAMNNAWNEENKNGPRFRGLAGIYLASLSSYDPDNYYITHGIISGIPVKLNRMSDKSWFIHFLAHPWPEYGGEGIEHRSPLVYRVPEKVGAGILHEMDSVGHPTFPHNTYRSPAPIQEDYYQNPPDHQKLLNEYPDAPFFDYTNPIQLDRQSLLDALARAAQRVHPSPTDPQRKAGNYRMGHVRIQGMDVTIESPAGSTRKGKDKKGSPWEVVMKHHYGYVKRTESEADRDHMDVFVGPNPESEVVFVIDQNIDDKFDEHKSMLGFTNAEEAKKAYHDNYSKDWKGFSGIRALTVDQFKKWMKRGHTHIPIAKQVLVFNSEPVRLALRRIGFPIKLGMSDIPALHAAIVHNPHDDAPWLIAADALDEVGKPATAEAYRLMTKGSRSGIAGGNIHDPPRRLYMPFPPGQYVTGVGGDIAGIPIVLYRHENSWNLSPLSGPRFSSVGSVYLDEKHGRDVLHEIDEAQTQSWNGEPIDYTEELKKLRHDNPPIQDEPQPEQLARPLPDWVPQENPDHPSPEKTGWVPVQSTWIAGLKLRPDRTTEMMVKKGGKTYPYPGINLAMFRRWIAAKSPGKWWWRNIGYPMMETRTPHKLSRFTGYVHPAFTPEADLPYAPDRLQDNKSVYPQSEVMEWAQRHVHPNITPAHLSALIGWLPGTRTAVFREGKKKISRGDYLAGQEPTSLTFHTYGPGFNTVRTIHSKNITGNNKPLIYNEESHIEPYIKDEETGAHTPNPLRGASAPALLRQMRAAYEVGIPKITWWSAWSEPQKRGGPSFADYTGGLHWPFIGANGYVPHSMGEIPQTIVNDADVASNGRFSQTREFADLFQSELAKKWYEFNPKSHKSFVDTTPGSYSRQAVERHVGENAVKHGMEGPEPDAAIYQQPEHAGIAEPVQMNRILHRRKYHEGIEHLLTTGSCHPEHVDLYFNK